MIIEFLFLCKVIETNEILFPRRTDHISKLELAGENQFTVNHGGKEILLR